MHIDVLRMHDVLPSEFKHRSSFELQATPTLHRIESSGDEGNVKSKCVLTTVGGIFIFAIHTVSVQNRANVFTTA